MAEEDINVTTFYQSPDNEKPGSLATGEAAKVVVEAGTSSIERTITVAEGGGSGTGSGSGGTAGTEMVMKRKRGRPRKMHERVDLLPYSISMSFGAYQSQPPFPKRVRGRPKGSGKLQILASIGGFAAETAGSDFIPHAVTVHTGEDVVGKILSFSQRGRRAICIMSANGVVSSVTIHQPGSSGQTLIYEGRFEILTLSGLFTFTEISGAFQKHGTLTVSLANANGRVFAGSVAGSLIAAGPIQLIIGSFKQNLRRGFSIRNSEGTSMGATVASDSALVAVPVSEARMISNNELPMMPTLRSFEPSNEGEAGEN